MMYISDKKSRTVLHYVPMHEKLIHHLGIFDYGTGMPCRQFACP